MGANSSFVPSVCTHVIPTYTAGAQTPLCSGEVDGGVVAESHQHTSGAGSRPGSQAARQLHSRP